MFPTTRCAHILSLANLTVPCSLAWAEMYVTLGTVVQQFDFKFEDVEAADFEMDSDQFIIGTKGKSILKAHVTRHKV